jgi:hypothetical protein
MPGVAAQADPAAQARAAAAPSLVNERRADPPQFFMIELIVAVS